MDELEFARRAGSQVVAESASRQAVTIPVYIRSAFGYRSVSFYGSINWNLANSLSLRASSQTGVAISIEFRGQERHTP